jgi:hypothetical protein
MRKRFVVCLNSSTPEQNKAFKDYISETGMGWWHWLGDTWLLTDSSGVRTAEGIRAKLKELYPGVHQLVLELRGKDDTWAGFGPNGANGSSKDMFKWLRENWK